LVHRILTTAVLLNNFMLVGCRLSGKFLFSVLELRSLVLVLGHKGQVLVLILVLEPRVLVNIPAGYDPKTKPLPNDHYATLKPVYEVIFFKSHVTVINVKKT